MARSEGTSGWTMRLPVRPLRGRWTAALERRLGRLVWDDPAAVLDPDVSPAAFSRAMAAMHVGSTIKITGAARHASSDALLLEHLDLRGATLLDVGASDGTTSVELVRRLPELGSCVIADLFLTARVTEVGRHLVLSDADGTCILVRGSRLVAWPRTSPLVRAAYAPVLAAARRRTPDREVLLLGPEARALVAGDPRVTTAVHDVFTPWTGPAPDVIKVANVLRRLYFDDDAIRRGLAALAASLREGGHLLLVDNVRQKGVAARGGLYRRTADGFRLVAHAEGTPEIEDLVLQVRVPTGRSVPSAR